MATKALLRVMLIASGILLVSTSSVALAAAAPASSPYGVVASADPLVDATAQMRQTAAAGVRWVRISVNWSQIEAQRGLLNWQRTDALVRAASDAGLQVVGTLAYTPAWAARYADSTPESAQRNRPKNVEDWPVFVARAVTRYRGRIAVWQMWEHPDLLEFRGTEKDFESLLRLGYAAAKKADPNCRVIMPLPAGLNTGALGRVLARGGAPYFDICGLTPDAASTEDLLRPVHAMRGMLDPLGKELWIVGGTACPAGRAAADPAAAQADHLVRLIALARAAGVAKVFWDNLASAPDGASLLDASLQPRAPWRAYRYLIQSVGDLPFVGRALVAAAPESAPASSDDAARLRASTYVLVFGRNDAGVAVAWQAGTPQSVRWRGLGDVTAVVDIFGQNLSPTGAEASAGLPPSQSPGLICIDSPAAGILQAAAAERRAHPILLPLAYPDYAQAETVNAMTAEQGEERGLYHRKYLTTDRCPIPTVAGGEPCYRSDVAKEFTHFRFDVDDSFLYSGEKTVPVTITVQCWGTDLPQQTGFKLYYDSASGYRFGPWQWVDAGEGWKEYSFYLEDAAFDNGWGWDFAVACEGSRMDIKLRSVQVRKGALPPVAAAAPAP